MNQNLFLQRHMANFPRIHGSLTALSLVLRPFVFKDHSYDIFLCCYCLAFFQDVSYCPFDIGPNNVAFVVKINAGEGMLEVHKYSKYVMFIGIQSQLVTQIWFNIYPCVSGQISILQIVRGPITDQIRCPRRDLGSSPCFEASQRPTDSIKWTIILVNRANWKTLVLSVLELKAPTSIRLVDTRCFSSRTGIYLGPKFCISS